MRQVHWLNLICFFFADAALSVDAGPRVSYVTDDGDETVSIPSGSDDGAEPESIDRAEFPEYEVLRSHSRKRYVRKAPELPGLPPVEGEVTVTCELVFEPQFIEEPVEPREPSKELDSEEPVVETETLGPLTEEGNGEAVVMLERLHRLYWSEGARMKAAHEARVREREERRAYLLANPPKPKDVRVRFWKSDTSSMRANSTEEK